MKNQEEKIMQWFLECRIEGRNIIIWDTIIWKTPREWTDAYDYIITDHFQEKEEQSIVDDPVALDYLSLKDFRDYIIELWNKHKYYMMIDNHEQMKQWEKTFLELKTVYRHIESFRKVKENWLPF